jgi:hypothetical protein
VVDHALSIHKALSLIPSIKKNEQTKTQRKKPKPNQQQKFPTKISHSYLEKNKRAKILVPRDTDLQML